MVGVIFLHCTNLQERVTFVRANGLADSRKYTSYPNHTTSSYYPFTPFITNG